MNSKNNRVNHDFQIVHFLAGSCHTADGAYALLCDLREDRENALKMNKAVELRQRAKLHRAREALRDCADEAARLEAEADIAEHDALAATTARNLAGAEAELAMLNRCIEQLQPLRRFAHLPDAQAHEAAQHDEWRLELIHRAENQMLTQGTLAPDLLATMRMHPAFATELLPLLDEIGGMLAGAGGHQKLMQRLATRVSVLPLAIG